MRTRSLVVSAGARRAARRCLRRHARRSPGADDATPQPSGSSRRRGGWDFDDEEEDVAHLGRRHPRAGAWTSPPSAPSSSLAFVSFFRKSVALKYATLVGAVVYLGFYKSQLISIVNVFGLFGGNLPIFRQNLAWYLLADRHRRLDRAVGTRLLRAASVPSARSRSCSTASCRTGGRSRFRGRSSAARR